MLEAPAAPAPVDATIITQPPVPAPIPPEKIIYPDANKPADPAAEPPPVKAADPAAPPAPPAEPKPPAEPVKPADPKSPPPAPADYDLTPPAGSLVSVEEVQALTKKAKEAGKTKEEAEGLLQERVEATQAFAKRQQDQLTVARKQWAEEAKNDPVYGGEKFAENAEKSRRVIDRFASPELKKMLDDTGMGNNPYVFRFVSAIANAFSEDQLVRGQSGPSDAKKAPEEVLYGKTTPGRQVA